MMMIFHSDGIYCGYIYVIPIRALNSLLRLQQLLHLIMNSETASTKNRKLIKVSPQQAQAYQKKQKQFQQIYEEEQLNFNDSKDHIYFIVSSLFLKSWRDFCNSNSLQRYAPVAMNSDLFKEGSTSLKQNLKEKVDFEIVSERLFRIISQFQGTPIKRNAVMIGRQKRVPIYLDSFKYLPIFHEDLKRIDTKAYKMEDLKLKTIEDSEDSQVIDLIQKIKDANKLTTQDIRLWRVDKKESIKSLWDYLVAATFKADYNYKIRGFGKRLSAQTKIGDLQMEEGDFFVAEIKESYNNWYLQAENEKKCEGCYITTELKFPCKCEKVAYCTEACKEKDKKFHIRNCDYAEMEELNKEVEMRLTANSSKGVVGLRNLGNTCFMNSCLQCLSNTYPLTEYFLRGIFEKEINKTNPLGSKGRLAKSYANFIKGTWCDSDNVFSPDGIKAAVARIAPMFSGYAQHDSQQFFSFLIDGLHQDLNRIQKKPYVESVESNNDSDKVVSLKSWIAHIKRNQSIITDLMTGQYKSKVTCPDCGKQSITFDPFITITLPIPQKIINAFDCFVIYKNMEKKTNRIAVVYTKAKAEDWIKYASKMLDIPEHRLAMYVVTVKQGIYRVGRDSTSQILHKVESENKNVFCFQLTEEETKMKDPLELTTRLCEKRSSMYYSYENLWYKIPFFFERQGTTGLHVYKRILRFLYGQAYDGSKHKAKIFGGTSLEDFTAQMLEKRPFELFIKYGRKIERYYQSVEYKFSSEIQLKDDMNLAAVFEKIDEKDCELEARFGTRGTDGFTFERLKDFDDLGKRVKNTTSTEDVTVDLSQCLDTLRESQKLEAGNEWYCPKCKEHKQADKQMSIYKAPNIMILHLKRFKQKGLIRKEKNESKVIFPLVLNMKEHLIDPTPMSTYIPEAKSAGVYINPSYNGDYKIGASEEPKYELYAVSNHFGGLGGGHYTAYAKNAGKWYDFNDSSVRAVSESSICGSGAYMLFYKRIE